MATRGNPDGPNGRGFAPGRPATEINLDSGGDDYMRRLPPGEGRYREYGDSGPHLKTLLGRLTEDVSQLAHDELTLAKLELRGVADTLSTEVKTAGKTMVKDMAKVGIALALAVLAGLALTAGAILAIGQLLGDAFWAGALIVGVLYLIAAAILGKSAADDLETSDAVRFEATKARARENKDVMAREVRENKQFAREEAEDFKRHVTADRKTTEVRH